MDTQTSTQRTRAAAAMAVLLLVGLCSFVVGGPLQAGAQDPQVASLSPFTESESVSFSDGGWLGLVEQFAPASALALQAADVPSEPSEDDADAGSPTFERDIALTSCASTPTLSVTYTVSSPRGLMVVDVRAFFGDELVEADVDFDESATELTFTKTFDLAEAKENGQSMGFVTLDVIDPIGGTVNDMLDLSFDFDRCTVQELVDADYPAVALDTPVLTCDSDPKLSVPYTVTATAGVAKVEVHGVVGSGFVERSHDFDGKATTLEHTEDFSLERIKEVLDAEKEFGDPAATSVDLIISAYDRDGRMASEGLAIDLDLMDCSFGPPDTSPPEIPGDGEYPEITVDSVDLTECDATPKLTISYTVSDGDGIVEIDNASLIGDEDINTAIEFESGAKQVQFDLVLEIDNPDLEIRPGIEVVDSVGAWRPSYIHVNIDTEACTAEIDDDDSWGPDPGDDGDGDYGDDWGGPTIVVDSIAIASCNATPVVSIGYTLTDEDGIIAASMFVPDAVDRYFVDLPDAFSRANKLTGEVEVPIDLLGESQVGTWLSIDASDSFGNPSWSDIHVEINLDDCTIERFDPWAF